MYPTKSMEENIMYNALDVAKYVVSKCTNDRQPINNLQLQKILYCIQKKFLNMDIKFIDDFVEAWQFGPVYPEVYYYFCGFGAIPITIVYDNVINIIDELQIVVDQVAEEKRIKEPWDLVEEIHHPGGAWDAVYRDGLGDHDIISNEMILKRG